MISQETFEARNSMDQTMNMKIETIVSKLNDSILLIIYTKRTHERPSSKAGYHSMLPEKDRCRTLHASV